MQAPIASNKAPMSTHRSFDLTTLPLSDTYKLLASTVTPRPIAWITTLDQEGRANAAPFSFFNVISSDPPLFCVGFSAAPDREGKDTLANIRASGELVINLVSEELAEAMNVTATNAPRGLDELVIAGLEITPSETVLPPRIAASPVSIECRTFQWIETGGSSTVLIARGERLHIRRDVFANEEKLYIDNAKLDLIGRMGGAGDYMRTRDTFTIPRIAWKDFPQK